MTPKDFHNGPRPMNEQRSEQYDRAWEVGFNAGLADDKRCTFPDLSDDALAWSSGWIVGEARRLQSRAENQNLWD